MRSLSEMWNAGIGMAKSSHGYRSTWRWLHKIRSWLVIREKIRGGCNKLGVEKSSTNLSGGREAVGAHVSICPGHCDAEQFTFPMHFYCKTSWFLCKIHKQGDFVDMGGLYLFLFQLDWSISRWGARGWGWGSSQVLFILLLSIHSPD